MRPKAIERDFPHVIEIAVPPGGLGKRLDATENKHPNLPRIRARQLH
jgi:hypothetical protein